MEVAQSSSTSGTLFFHYFTEEEKTKLKELTETYKAELFESRSALLLISLMKDAGFFTDLSQHDFLKDPSKLSASGGLLNDFYTESQYCREERIGLRL